MFNSYPGERLGYVNLLTQRLYGTVIVCQSVSKYIRRMYCGQTVRDTALIATDHQWRQEPQRNSSEEKKIDFFLKWHITVCFI